MKNKIIEWWKGLSEDKRNMVAAIATIVLLVLLIIAIPWKAWNDTVIAKELQQRKSEESIVAPAMAQAYATGFDVGLLKGLRIGLGLESAVAGYYAGAGDNTLQTERKAQ